MSDRVFVDTDILLVAHDLDGAERRAIAEQILRQLWQDRSGATSTLVLQEFYDALIGGASPVPRRAARELLDAYSAWPAVALDADDLLAASEIEERHRLSFRDALVVVAARKSRATLLLSDQIVPARHVTGLEIRNPFA